MIFSEDREDNIKLDHSVWKCGLHWSGCV